MSTERSLEDRKSLFDRFLDAISFVNTLFTGIALVFLTGIFGWLVFGRYVLNATPTWVEQVSLLLILYIGFLGASVGIHKQTHLGVSVFREISPKPVQLVFELLSHILMLGFGLIMIVYGYKLTVFRWTNEIPLIRVSEGWRSLPIFLSGICIVLFTIGHLIHFFSRTNKKEPEKEELVN